MKDERFFQKTEAANHTLAEAIDRFIDEVTMTKQRKCQLLWWKESIGHMFLSAVTMVVVSDTKALLVKRKGRTGKLSGSSINRYIADLSCVFTAAKRKWYWTDKNPVEDVIREKEPKGRVRYLTDEERTSLLTVCAKDKCPFIHLVVVLALSTGMRKQEIRHLKWDDIDLENGIIILTKTKNKEPRRVAIRGKALELLKAHAKVRYLDTNYLFRGGLTAQNDRPFDFRKAWNRVLKKSKIKNFCFHDLRHSCASYLAMNGASALEIAEALGHKSLDMVKRYSHLSESHVASVVESMNQKIFGS